MLCELIYALSGAGYGQSGLSHLRDVSSLLSSSACGRALLCIPYQGFLITAAVFRLLLCVTISCQAGDIMLSLCSEKETAPHLNLRKHAQYISEVEETASQAMFLSEVKETASQTMFLSEVEETSSHANFLSEVE